MNTSEQTDQIFCALVNAQSEIQTIKRDKTAKIQGAKASFEFKYAALDSIFEQVKPILKTHGLGVLQSLDAGELATRVIHTSGQWVESRTPMGISHQDMKQFGAESTYKRRYAYSSILGIVSDDDIDAPESRQKKDAPIITPRGGIGDNLPEDWKVYLRDLAGEITDMVAQGKIQLAKDAADKDNLDSDQRVYLESQLTSTVRSALKKPIDR